MDESIKIESLDAKLLDITFRGKDYLLYYGDKPLATPLGTEIAHTNLRLLQHLLFELSINNETKKESVSSYSMFGCMKDQIEMDNDSVFNCFEAILNNDYIYNLKVKHQNYVSQDSIELLELFESNNYMFNIILGGVSSIQNKLNRFLVDNGYEESSNGDLHTGKFSGFLKDTYSSLPPSYKAAVNILNVFHHAGIILPLLFVSSKISPSEYTVMLYTMLLFTGREKPFEEFKDGNNTGSICFSIEDSGKFFKDIHSQALKVTEFLSYFGIHKDSSSSILELIKTGESSNLEFKSSLRWNIKALKKDTAIEHASLKTINGFLNSSGGNLLIGVRDDGTIEGIESDQFQNDDKFLLHFWNLVKESFGNDITTFIKCSLEKIDNKTICNVQCLKSPVPVFLTQKGFEEEFYIRVGPSSVKLGVSETYKYISQHFKANN